MNSNENAIKEAAYYIWQNAGCPTGQDDMFWSMAVEQISSCKCSSSAAKKAPCKRTTSSASKASSTTKKAATSSKKSK